MGDVMSIARKMRSIPVKAGERIAKEFGYDQVIIIARRVGEKPDPHGEHVTTYGITRIHCDVAARTGSYVKREIMGWPEQPSTADINKMIRELTNFVNGIETGALIVDHADETLSNVMKRSRKLLDSLKDHKS